MRVTSPPKWPSAICYDLTVSRQGFETKYQNPWSLIIVASMWWTRIVPCIDANWWHRDITTHMFLPFKIMWFCWCSSE